MPLAVSSLKLHSKKAHSKGGGLATELLVCMLIFGNPATIVLKDLRPETLRPTLSE